MSQTLRRPAALSWPPSGVSIPTASGLGRPKPPSAVLVLELASLPRALEEGIGTPCLLLLPGRHPRERGGGGSSRGEGSWAGSSARPETRTRCDAASSS